MSTMAEGFEPYHVPQQSRRDKLRVCVSQNNQPPHQSLLQPLLPFYDSSFMNLSSSSSSSSNSSSVSLSHHAYLDPAGLSSLPLNQVISNNPFLYHQAQNLDQNLDDDQSMMFKPEALSLSLSSSHRSGSNYGGVIYGGGGGCVIPGLVGGGSGNSGPFTGYASVLKDSRFLKPAMELLDEMCDVGGGGGGEKVVVVAEASLLEPPLERSLSEDPLVGDGGEGRKKYSRMLAMLDEVYKRYRQYYQQMQAVVTSFEYVSGLCNAAPYASLAIKVMSQHFRFLKKAITDQLQFTNKAHFHMSNRKDESPRFRNSERGGPYSQRSGFLEHQQPPVWRPQRGLPDRAVTVLRAWLFEHFLHPYPTDTDKILLAKQTGLSRSQVSNWFINARVRLWKPMVEEIHVLETRQAPKNSQKEKHCSSRNKSSDHLPSDTSLVSENPSASTGKFQDATYKRAMNELPNIPIRNQEQQLNLPQPVGVGMSMGRASSNNNNKNSNSNNSVSLTLGLYQNHGIGLAEPFPLSAAQRFGLALETNNEGFVMSGFESQNRHFGRDVIGGQMFHDFVG